MADHRPNNKTLDDIGRRLMEARALRDSEIDAVANGRGLFDGVLSRIDAAEKVESKRGFGSFIFANRFAVGSAFAAVLCMGVFAILLQQNPGNGVSLGNKIPEQHPDVTPPGKITPQVIVNGVTAGGVIDLEREAPREEPVVQQTLYRQSRPSQPTVQQASYSRTQDTQFYPVTYTGDGGESARGGRVVRVDVPRSSLFAMGINVPLENESPTVKADLLIGPDGVTRAIRLVD